MQIHWDIYHSSETFNKYEDEGVCGRFRGWGCSVEAITAQAAL